MKKLLGILFGLAAGLPAFAQSPADITAVGQAAAAALNKRDAPAMMQLLDGDAVSTLILKDMGLSQSDRDQVRQGLAVSLRRNIELSMKALEGNQGSVRFMRAGNRAGKPYALLRYDLGDQGIDYVEYYVTSGRRVEDWYVHSVALFYSASARLDLATMLKTDSMLFGLFGSKLSTQADIKPFNDLRAALSAQDYKRAYQVLEQFPEGYRKSRQWALMRVSYGGRIGEETHRAALRFLATNFGGDVDLQFMLIDHYFFEKQYDRALKAVAALESNIGGEDAATQNLRGSLLGAAQDWDGAARACRRAQALEPDHKPAFWCLVNIGLAHKDWKLALEALTLYEKAFKVSFDPDKLAQIDVYQELARSPEYAAWAKPRKRK